MTPAPYSENLTREAGNALYLKLENLNVTGSFKERGALNRLLLMSAAERGRGVVAASAGNHAQGIAYHAARLGIRAVDANDVHHCVSGVVQPDAGELELRARTGFETQHVGVKTLGLGEPGGAAGIVIELPKRHPSHHTATGVILRLLEEATCY